MTWCKEAINLSFSKKKIKLLHNLIYAVLWGYKEIRSTLYNINAKQKLPSKLRGLGGSLSMIKFEENFQINAGQHALEGANLHRKRKKQNSKKISPSGYHMRKN